MFNDKYHVVVKTGQSEIRAVENILHSKDNIIPLIELTRGRKTKLDEIGRIERRIDKMSEVFMNNSIILDLTTANELTNKQIDNLYDYQSGYKKYRLFLRQLKNDNKFKKIVPVLLQNFNDDNYENNFIKQFDKLANDFDTIAFRSNIVDDGCYDDLELIKHIIEQKKVNFLFIIDCEYIAPGAWHSFADKCIERIQNIIKITDNVEFLIISTSFPKYVGEIGNDEEDSFLINEIQLYKKVKKSFASVNIHYGDYGSVNPQRNDTIKLKHGWIPRIDVPTKKEVFYHRKRRESDEQPYSEVYYDLAKNKVIVDKRFPHSLKNNWGVKQIKLCANGNIPGSSPSFWISVRMNIHIEQQVNRVKD